MPKPSFIFFNVSCFLYVGGFCTLTLVINKLLMIRDKRNNESPQEVFKLLAKNFASDLKNYVFNFFIVYVAYYALSVALNYIKRISVFTDYSDLDLGPLNFFINWLVIYMPSIIILPLLMYFAFSALFISIRDDIGSSDALKKIYDISKNKLKEIWLSSLAVLFSMYFANELLVSVFSSINMLLPFNLNFFFIVSAVQKLLSLGFFVFMQVASVLLLGSVEDDLEGHYIKNKIAEI